jgi:hypothetical protein
VIRFGVVADVRRHSERAKPLVKEEAEAARLVLIDENRVAKAA